MRHPVLLLVRNNLELTKRCVASICNQDIPVSLFVIDNGSSDGTDDWLSSDAFTGVWQRFDPQLGVSCGWNFGLNRLFYDPVWNAQQVLVPNSDTELPPWIYRRLLECDQAFVTGVSVGNRSEITQEPPVKELSEAPDLSLFCIHRECWEKVGEFDPTMVHYASDLDYHIRAWRKGVHLMNAGVPFYHERSSTLKNASPKDKRMIELQADADRKTFFEKWGVHACSGEYDGLFSPDTFGIEA